MGSLETYSNKLGIILLIINCNCVISSFERLSTVQINPGPDKFSQEITNLSSNTIVVGLLTIKIIGLNTSKRRYNYLLRKASLLGCDGVFQIVESPESTSGKCIILINKKSIQVTHE